MREIDVNELCARLMRPARPRLEEAWATVDGVVDPSEAWECLASRGLVPFRGEAFGFWAPVSCEGCNGRGSMRSETQTTEATGLVPAPNERRDEARLRADEPRETAPSGAREDEILAGHDRPRGGRRGRGRTALFRPSSGVSSGECPFCNGLGIWPSSLAPAPIPTSIVDAVAVSSDVSGISTAFELAREYASRRWGWGGVIPAWSTLSTPRWLAPRNDVATLAEKVARAGSDDLTPMHEHVARTIGAMRITAKNVGIGAIDGATLGSPEARGLVGMPSTAGPDGADRADRAEEGGVANPPLRSWVAPVLDRVCSDLALACWWSFVAEARRRLPDDEALGALSGAKICDLPDPFEPLVMLWGLGYVVSEVHPGTIVLWAPPPIAREPAASKRP